MLYNVKMICSSEVWHSRIDLSESRLEQTLSKRKACRIMTSPTIFGAYGFGDLG